MDKSQQVAWAEWLTAQEQAESARWALEKAVAVLGAAELSAVRARNRWLEASESEPGHEVPC